MRKSVEETLGDKNNQYFPVGEAPTETVPGDIVLFHGYGSFKSPKTWTSPFIRFGQRLRPEIRPWAFWNHAAVVSNKEGGIIEALGNGVSFGTLADHKDESFVVCSPTRLSKEDRAQGGFLCETRLGRKYGFFTILSCAYTLLTGGKFGFSMVGSDICSGLAAAALERGWYVFDLPTDRIMPAHLGKVLGAQPPALQQS